MRGFFIIIAGFAMLSCNEDKVQEALKTVKNAPEKNVNAEVASVHKDAASVNKDVASVNKVDANTMDELAKTIVDFGNNPLFLMNIPRDPFSLSQNQQTFLNDAESEDNLCEDLLCGFEISQLSLVAVMSGGASPVAMLEDTQGTGYVVKKNSRIGKYGGRISNIYQNCLVVSEPSQNMKSGVKDTILCVKPEDMNAMSVDLMSNRQVQ